MPTVLAMVGKESASSPALTMPRYRFRPPAPLLPAITILTVFVGIQILIIETGYAILLDIFAFTVKFITTSWSTLCSCGTNQCAVYYSMTRAAIIFGVPTVLTVAGIELWDWFWVQWDDRQRKLKVRRRGQERVIRERRIAHERWLATQIDQDPTRDGVIGRNPEMSEREDGGMVEALPVRGRRRRVRYRDVRAAMRRKG